MLLCSNVVSPPHLAALYHVTLRYVARDSLHGPRDEPSCLTSLSCFNFHSFSAWTRFRITDGSKNGCGTARDENSITGFNMSNREVNFPAVTHQESYRSFHLSLALVLLKQGSVCKIRSMALFSEEEVDLCTEAAWIRKPWSLCLRRWVIDDWKSFNHQSARLVKGCDHIASFRFVLCLRRE